MPPVSRRRTGRHREDPVRLSAIEMFGLIAITALFGGAIMLAYTRIPDQTHHLSAQRRDSSNPKTIAGHLSQSSNPIRSLSGGNEPEATDISSSAAHFGICTGDRWRCVIDGDTFILDGNRIRLADIDAPEIGGARCEYEYRLGLRAKYRLVELLNEGSISLQLIGNRDKDRYGRELRVVLGHGHSIGDRLVNEGLARTWTGRREPWC
jgi:endonuclease YncB( thermonuclease family)